MRFNLELEYKRVAKKYNLTEKQVKEIFQSQFECARLAMKEGVKNDSSTFKNIHFIKFGKLYANIGMIDKYKKIAEDKLKKKEDGKNN